MEKIIEMVDKWELYTPFEQHVNILNKLADKYGGIIKIEDYKIVDVFDHTEYTTNAIETILAIREVTEWM